METEVLGLWVLFTGLYGAFGVFVETRILGRDIVCDIETLMFSVLTDSTLVDTKVDLASV